MVSQDFHVPVMPQEVIDLLKPKRGGIYVDGTVGGAGHARIVAERLSESDRLIGIELDYQALKVADENLQGVPPQVTLVHGDWKDTPEIMLDLQVCAIDGCLLDMGVSSHQIDDPKRGFSYRFPDAPLDMRMNADDDVTAGYVLNRYSQGELTRILREYGEERWASRIARFIVRRRETEEFRTVGDLLEAVNRAIPADARRRGGHPARRTFQALRIEVNRELENIKGALEEIVRMLAPGGRMVAISFHSLEDRPVKRVFRDLARECRCPPDLPVCRCEEQLVRDLTRKPLRPTCEEIQANPRASSAKLRAVERLSSRKHHD